MSWLQALADELTVRGVRGAERQRILLELRDHIACEPGCEARLGEPRALAGAFADELATSRTRAAAFTTFAALAFTALVLALSQVALPSPPRYDHGLSTALFWPAAIGMLIAPQVALVAGTLAAWRALRRGWAVRLPAREVGLIARRARIALLAGAAVAAGLELYVLDFSMRLPVWWLCLVGGLSALAGIGLATAWRDLRQADRIVSSVPGEAGDIFDDLPLLNRDWLLAAPWRLGLSAAVTVGLLMTAFAAHAERSLQEGLQRGVAEGVAAALGFVLLGRAIGVVREPEGRPPAGGQLPTDA